MDCDTDNDISLFENLPTEIILKIFQMVDVETVYKSLMDVCTRFQLILIDQFFWRQYLINIYGKKCHMVQFLQKETEAELDCRELLYDAYKRENRWKNCGKDVRTFTLTAIHDGSVDSIHLMENGYFIVSGSRDRGVAVCNLTQAKLPTNDDDISWSYAWGDPEAHSGWVWSITSVGKDIYTGSWDSTIKVWSYENGALVQKNMFSGQQAVLSLSANDTLLAAGLWANEIKLFDTRLGFSSVHEYLIHKKGVLDVNIHGNYIISASEDRTVGIYDYRAQKKVRTIRIGSKLRPAIPLKICCKSNAFYVGDNKGYLHVIHPTECRKMAYIQGPTKNVTGIVYAPGMLIATSTDTSIRINRPTSPLVNYAIVKSKVGCPVAVDFLNDVLAIGGSDCSVQLWFPEDCPILDVCD